MEKHFEDFFFKEYYYFLKETPKGSEGEDLFNTRIKEHINRMAEKQMQGDTGECDLPGRLLQARIITTNRSSLNTDCGALPEVTTSHSPAQSHIYITKHIKKKQNTQSIPIPT